MKQALARLLYMSFLVLALRVHGATPGEAPLVAPRADASTQIALASTLLHRYRETAREEFVTQAQAAITAALALAPEDYIAQRTAVAVMLARHDDAAALERITALNLRFPDDVDTYALLIDAELALGRHAQAELYTQRLLDLRPDNLPGLTRAARLRELYGDWQGAIDFINATINRVTTAEVEERAWLYVQLARLHFGAGRPEIAHAALDAALTVMPDYPVALEEGLRIDRLSGATAAALKTAQHLYRVAPSATHLFWLARATAQAGDPTGARKLFDEFLGAASAITGRDENANLALSAYYLDEGRDPIKALAVAKVERARRADPRTVVVYAAALHGVGRDADARGELDTLLALGYRDADLLFTAGEIFAAGSDPLRARELLSAALASAPHDPRAATVQLRLRALAADNGTSTPSEHKPTS